jgi:hypothetical protein
MATQIVTFPSDSGTAITAQRPDVRLVIPNDGAVYDLSQSRVRISMQTTVQTDNRATSVAGFYAGDCVIDRVLRYQAPGFVANSAPAGRESFIRNVRISDQRHGVVDVRRYNNNLMTTLNEYQRSRTERIHSGAFDTYSGTIGAQEVGGLFMQRRNYGTVKSTPRVGVVDVPLSDITDLARTGESRLWPTSFTGETVLELEMEPFENFAAIPAKPVQTTVAQSPAIIAFTDTQGANPPAATTTYRSVPNIDYDGNPYYVGMPVTLLSTGATTIFTTITAIQRSGQQLDVTLATASATAATAAVRIIPYFTDTFPAATQAFTYVRVELQMVRVMTGAIPRSISYMSYGLRDLSQSTNQNFTTTVQVPSDRTPNVLVLWKKASNLQSTEENCLSYRFSINDEYEAPTINFRTSQHYEMIVRGFRNAGMTLRDLLELLPNSIDANAFDATATTAQLKLVMIPMPLMPPGMPENVIQLEITYATDADRRLLIYAQQMSTLQLSDVGSESGTGPAF